MWILQITTAAISVLSLIVTASMFIAVKFNDVKHIQLAVEKIEQHINSLTQELKTEHQENQKEFKAIAILLKEQTTICNERSKVRNSCKPVRKRKKNR